MLKDKGVLQGSNPASDGRVDLLSTGLSGTNLERGSDHNLRVTLQAIRLNAPITKVELAEITGLTPPSISNITRKLLADGLILEAGRRRGERGQPALRLAIDPDGAFSIGLNIDRDHITLVALDFLGRVRARIFEEIDFAMPHQVVDFLQRNLEVVRASGAVNMERIAGIGVAIPDDFSRVDLPFRPQDFRIWETVDFRSLFSAFDLEVFIENDASAAAMGELQFGYGRAAQTFFYVLISSGLGGGLVIDGHPVRGSSGRSGEIGFLPLSKARRSRANLQDVVSLSGLFGHLAESGYSNIGVEDLGRLDGPIANAALAWAEKSADLLCEPLLVINAAIDPEAIFIGGRLPSGLVEALCDRLAVNIRHRGASLPARAAIRRAALAEDAAAMGAAVLAFSNRFLPSRDAILKT